MNPKVEVLMSTYNGEDYLESQIDSILKQNKVEVYLLIRDDGSKDSTIQILRDYEKKYNNIRVIFGKNIGWKRSFFELLKKSDKNADFYAFSDQDDVWIPDKLSISIKEEMYADIPMVHQSIAQLVDSDLNPLVDYKEYRNPRNINEALICSWSQGAAMTFNKRARDLALSYQPNDNAAHDMWIYLICYFMGKVIFEMVPTIQYRQHEHNVTSGAASGKGIWSFYFARRQLRKLFAGELYCNYGNEIYLGFEDYLDIEKKEVLKLWHEYKKKVSVKGRLLFDPTVKRRTFGGSVALKFAILFSLY